MQMEQRQMSLCVFDIAITIETHRRSQITFRITQ